MKANSTNFASPGRREHEFLKTNGASIFGAMIHGSLFRCVGPMRRWPMADSSMERHCRPSTGSSGLAKGTETETVIERSDTSMKRFADIAAELTMTAMIVWLESRKSGGPVVQSSKSGGDPAALSSKSCGGPVVLTEGADPPLNEHASAPIRTAEEKPNDHHPKPESPSKVPDTHDGQK